jgi:hypothetical protein
MLYVRNTQVHLPFPFFMTDQLSFLDVIEYEATDGNGQRQKLLGHFGVPDFVGNKTCFELNGYFGSKARYSDQLAPPANHVTSYSRFLTDPAGIAKS